MYRQQVLKILMDVGERGMSAALLSKHVYNLNCTLFHQPDVDGIRRWVWQFLRGNAHSKKPLVEHTGRHGYYRLNKRGISYMRQLTASQQEEQDGGGQEKDKRRQPELPGLFDWQQTNEK